MPQVALSGGTALTKCRQLPRELGLSYKTAAKKTRAIGQHFKGTPERQLACVGGSGRVLEAETNGISQLLPGVP